MAIDTTNGNVGIGTSSPDRNLVVNSGASSGYIQLANTASGTAASNGFEIKLDSAGAIVDLINRENGDMRLWTNNSERMRIDSSGNLLVGKTTSDGGGTAGLEYHKTFGVLYVTDSGGESAVFNRLSSDGDIVRFRKDGTTVGSIGHDDTSSATHKRTYIGYGDTGLAFIPTLNEIVGHNTTTNAANSGITLGDQNVPFEDLYLSGGVYLGGTGSANKLDDYEEGTWTPSVSTGAVSLTGTYIKVGKLVSIFLNGQVTTGGATTISGLPFNTAGNYGFSPYVSTQDIPSGQNSITFVTNGSTLLVRAIGDNTTFSSAALTTGTYIHASFVYESA
jgi:hypothetical protein